MANSFWKYYIRGLLIHQELARLSGFKCCVNSNVIELDAARVGLTSPPHSHSRCVSHASPYANISILGTALIRPGDRLGPGRYEMAQTTSYQHFWDPGGLETVEDDLLQFDKAIQCTESAIKRFCGGP